MPKLIKVKQVNADGIAVIRNGVKDGIYSDIPAERKPPWLRVRIAGRGGARLEQVRQAVRSGGLSTVCEEAMCPNLSECWSAGTATIMLMGSVCTRACRFCAVDTGNPRGALDADEPRKTAEAVRAMGLSYVVLTSVNRDDLPDGGASHYAETVRQILKLNPDTDVEALVPDFRGALEAVEEVAASGIVVFAQNMETVRRLTHPVRDARAGYDQTLRVLARARQSRPGLLTKTSLILGLGESDAEIAATMDDLRAADVDILTMGQYLRPSRNHLPVARWVTPEEFAGYRRIGLQKGFLEVVSGPLVRSSYRAERALERNNAGIELAGAEERT